MDIAAQIDEFRQLKDGWHEGKGFAPKHEGLDWLTNQFETNYADQLPLPYLYPTGEGGIQAEWMFEPWEVSLDINLEMKSARWHALDHQTDEEAEEQVDLASLEGWMWLEQQLTRMRGGQFS